MGAPPKRPGWKFHLIDEMLGAMCTNGSAVEGVCVTGADNRPIVLFVSTELSRLQAGMARYLHRRVRLVLRSRYKTKVY